MILSLFKTLYEKYMLFLITSSSISYVFYQRRSRQGLVVKPCLIPDSAIAIKKSDFLISSRECERIMKDIIGCQNIDHSRSHFQVTSDVR